jgi:negative regulator of sigma E activity
MKKVILPLVILCIAVLGCSKIKELAGGAKGNPDSSGSGGGSSTSGANPKEDIIQASKKFIALPAFSARMNGMGQTEIKSQVDYVAPDRYHVSYLSGNGAGMEMIMIGNDSYMKTGGKWTKVPGNANAIPTLRDSFTEEGLKTLADAKFEGNDTIDGKPALVYSYKNVTPKGGFGFNCKMWVGTQTGLPIKIYATYDNGILKEMTVNYDSEAKVAIEPPMQ